MSTSVNLDIPLFIRLLEVAREEVKSDEELHKLVERVLAQGEDLLTMDNYDAIMGHPGQEDQPEVDADLSGITDVILDDAPAVGLEMPEPSMVESFQKSFENILDTGGPMLKRGRTPSLFTVDEVRKRGQEYIQENALTAHVLKAASRLRVLAAPSPEQCIKIAADDITKLRRVDVFRVLDTYKGAAPQIAKYILDNRPDLKAEVLGVLEELGLSL